MKFIFPLIALSDFSLSLKQLTSPLCPLSALFPVSWVFSQGAGSLGGRLSISICSSWLLSPSPASPPLHVPSLPRHPVQWRGAARQERADVTFPFGQTPSSSEMPELPSNYPAHMAGQWKAVNWGHTDDKVLPARSSPATHNSHSCVLKCSLRLSSLSCVRGQKHQDVPARGLKSVGDTRVPPLKGLGRGTPGMALEEKKIWVCPKTACSQPQSHPELPPRQKERRSGG